MFVHILNICIFELWTFWNSPLFSVNELYSSTLYKCNIVVSCVECKTSAFFWRTPWSIVQNYYNNIYHTFIPLEGRSNSDFKSRNKNWLTKSIRNFPLFTPGHEDIQTAVCGSHDRHLVICLHHMRFDKLAIGIVADTVKLSRSHHEQNWYDLQREHLHTSIALQWVINSLC